MPTIKQEFSSKTNWINVVAPVLVAVLQSQGIQLDPASVIAVLGAVNIIVRHFTNKPLSEK